MAFSLLPRRRPPRPPTPKPAIKTEAEIIADAKADVVPTLKPAFIRRPMAGGDLEALPAA